MNKGLLIADSGSTKTDWLFVAPDGERFELHTDGINPARDTRVYIYNVLSGTGSLPLRGDIEGAVYFYGAGCIEPFSDHQSVVFSGVR